MLRKVIIFLFIFLENQIGSSNNFGVLNSSPKKKFLIPTLQDLAALAVKETGDTVAGDMWNDLFGSSMFKSINPKERLTFHIDPDF